MKWRLTTLQPSSWNISVDGVEIESRTSSGLFTRYASMIAEDGRRLDEDWRERVWMAMKDKHPQAVTQESGRGRVMLDIPTMGAFLKFLKNRITKKMVPVSVELAVKRAKVCLSCPLHEQVAGCTVCKVALKSVVKLPEQSRQDLLRKLGPERQRFQESGCRACLCYLPVKVFLPRELLGPAEAFSFSEECWMRQESLEECLD